MGIVLKLLRIYLFQAELFGDLTLELVTAAIYQHQSKFQARLAAAIFLISIFQGFLLSYSENEKGSLNLLKAVQLVYLGSSLPRCWSKAPKSFQYFSDKYC